MTAKTMSTPCKRHKPGEVRRFRVTRDDSERLWAVVEWRGECLRCKAETPVRVVRSTISTKGVREALAKYGCTDAERETYLRAHYPDLAQTPQPVGPASKSPAVAVRLTSWPFPVSTHYPKPAAPAQFQSRRRPRAAVVLS